MNHTAPAIAVTALFLLSGVYAAEILTRANGDRVLLRDDHTWVGLENATGFATASRLNDAKLICRPNEAVEIWDKSLSLANVNNRNTVALCIHYLNNASKKVISVTVNVAVFTSFGKLLFQRMYEDIVTLQPGERLRNTTCWHFDDDPYVPGEPYDLLWKVAQKGTAKMAISVRKVVFEDGNVLAEKPKN